MTNRARKQAERDIEREFGPVALEPRHVATLEQRRAILAALVRRADSVETLSARQIETLVRAEKAIDDAAQFLVWAEWLWLELPDDVGF